MKRIGNVILILFMLLCLGVMGVAGGRLYKILSNYHASNRLYDDLKDSYVSDQDETGDEKEKYASASGAVRTPILVQSSQPRLSGGGSEEDVSWASMTYVDISGLKQTNPDAAGWIYFEDGSISYPVMFSGDDSKYLHTAYDGSYAFAGALFIEGMNASDFSDSHTIIYGHNMRNLSMFGKLKNYYLDSAYYPEHQYFQIFTENAVYRYHIFAYEQVDANSFVYTVPYSNTEEFQGFINSVRNLSMIGFGDEVSSEDHIITLSTCTTGDGRFVVHAVRVAEAYYQ